MGARNIRKDPEANRVYGWDLTTLLDEGDSVVDFTPEVPAGLTLEDSSLVGDQVNLRLSGGDAGADYRVRVEFTTAYGDVDGRSRIVYCRTR